MAAVQSGSSCHITLQPDGIRLAAKAQVPLPTSAPPSLSWVLTIELSSPQLCQAQGISYYPTTSEDVTRKCILGFVQRAFHLPILAPL